MKPAIVLFDLGNVLVRFKPKSFWDTLNVNAGEGKAPSLVTHWNHRFERGEISTSEYLRGLFDAFEGRFSEDDLSLAAASVLTEPVEGMEELVGRVRESVPAGLVSNTNELHYEFCRRAVPTVRQLFPHYLSYRIGVMKPLDGFYRAVIDDLHEKPERLLFIDDVEGNIRGAERNGMRGILFISSAALGDDLRRLGVF